MKNYVLIGQPLGHSMSPLIHGRLFKLRGREADYKLNEIPAGELSSNLEFFKSLNGFNVTIPYKLDIIELLDGLGESAARYSSVNCVDNRDGKLIGYNTDCDGFLLSVSDFPIDKNVLLVGCGGVGRMMAIEVALHRGSLTMAIIPEAKPAAEELKEDILKLVPDARVDIQLVSEVSGSFDIILNSSPVGMHPKTDACPVSDGIIESCSHVFDAVYNPVETLLIKKAKAMGKTALGGAAMLVYQAVKAHEIWDGDTYTKEEVSEIIRAVEDEINS